MGAPLPANVIGCYHGPRWRSRISRLTACGATERERRGLKPVFLFTIDNWASVAGGVQTVNRELACALAQSTHSATVACVVPRADSDELRHARVMGVDLIVTGPFDDMETVLGTGDLRAIPHREVRAVVGHGRFSGPLAKTLRDTLYTSAKLVHFVHASPLDTEHLKESNDQKYVVKREKRLADETALAVTADIVACIGPRLTRFMTDELGSRACGAEKVLRLDCGITNSPRSCNPPQRPLVLSLGRTESIRVKGLDIFARAAHHVLRQWDANPATRKRQRPQFVVRGAVEEPDSLAAQLEAFADSASEVRFRVLPYTTSADEHRGDFLRASVFVMPSREEGFGLVACEALSYGVPVVASAQSGLAEVIQDLRDNQFFDPGPTLADPTGDLDIAAQRFAHSILSVLEDEPRAARRTISLLKALAPSCSWNAAAERLFGALS